VSAQHVASQGRGAGLTWRYLAEFVGSQFGVLTPLVAAILAWGLWHGFREGLVRRREPYRFLMAFAAPVLLFYLALALQGKVQANWAAAAYPPLALATAGALLQRRARLGPARRRAQTALLVGAGGLALGLSLLGHTTDLLGLPARLDPTSRLKGWRELGAAVGEVRGRMPAPERTFLVSDRYQIASELAFYVSGASGVGGVGGGPPTYNLNLGRRLNQYDFWEGPNVRIGWDAIYVQEEAGRPDERVVAAFERVEGPLVLEVRRGGQVVRTFALYRGYGFRGVTGPSGPLKY
jgi:undecaprenyl-diphosphatase